MSGTHKGIPCIEYQNEPYFISLPVKVTCEDCQWPLYQ